MELQLDNMNMFTVIPFPETALFKHAAIDSLGYPDQCFILLNLSSSVAAITIPSFKIQDEESP